MKKAFTILSLCLAPLMGWAATGKIKPSQTIDLWPDRTAAVAGAEGDTTKPGDALVAGKPVIRLGNVSAPTVSLYRPGTRHDTGATVVVCPGGGYHILAMDLEGTEICEWLNSIGVTAALLKYRVPKREGTNAYALAYEDAQRATGLLRQQAGTLKLDPRRIGVLGFSAGGHLAALMSNTGAGRSYARVDSADEVNCRPDFAILVYPAYLTLKEKLDTLSPEMTVSSNTPPTFVAIAEDDPVHVEGALYYALALKQAKVPFELHVYPRGGHGYGSRPNKNLVTTWPRRAADWLAAEGFLDRAR